MKLICLHRIFVFGPVRTVLSVAVFLCVLFSIFLIGCGKAERHKVLSFFFDGVPPLGLEYLDPNSPDYAEQVKRLEAASRASVHRPEVDCDHCHKDGILNKPIPKLCYTCHEDYSKQGIHVHGPVLVGDCLFCHRPHESSNPYLLTRSIPALCFRCHDRKAVDLIDSHDDERYNNCTGCHSGHGSGVKGMLKKDGLVIPQKQDTSESVSLEKED